MSELTEFEWHKLNDDMKLEVIKRSSYLTRCRLRKCSKSDKSLVDRVPISEIEIGFAEDEYRHTEDSKPYLMVHDAVNDENWSYNKGDDKDRIADFMRIFNNRNTLVRRVYFDFFSDDSNSCPFFSKLLTELDAHPKCIIQSEHFDWRCHQASEQYLLQVLEKFDSHNLKKISLNGIISEEKVKALSETDQWKNTSKFDIATSPSFGELDNDVKVKSEYIQHAENVHMKNYRESDRNVASFFMLDVDQEYFEWKDVLLLFDVPVTNVSVASESSTTHTQRFEMSTRGRVLVVELSNYGVKGCVCREEQIDEDFNRVFNEED
ncbi:hypothetical protein GCK72_019547 [Caenorhabditis remanei]|uniref:Uncharacterized protein n=1 Tax=Caenorhabditis remanei TaxID=31234 RepID=A0A6A5GES3_CAERE|nr:hypothetical protein GCK72_019547 [Caenorhabditis remanei]KAF1752992.1 hypothetical protein GCK72_019547 [Caenorhabditis remanei]